MRRYLLDTSPLAALLLARPAAVALITPWIERHEAATSILAYAEVVEYIKGQADSRAAMRTSERCLAKSILTFSPTVSWSAMPTCAAVRPPHGPGLIGDMDTLIAATALERNLTVVTIDTDFQRVPDLRVILLSRATMQVLSTP
jgi:predicted nucleic acid-binding protein